MSANLSERSDGRAEMMYVGEVPWHGRGTKLDQAATAEEAIKAAGLDWTVEKQKVYWQDAGEWKEFQGKRAVVRTDTRQVLGMVGERHHAVQNKNAFQFFDAVIGLKAAVYHTAGALGNGERIWMMAKLPGDIEVVKQDIVEQYLLLANSHDGTLKLTMTFTPIRVVCQNTLTAALSESNGKVGRRHSLNVINNPEEMREQLGIVSVMSRLFKEAAQKLVSVPLDQKKWDTYRNAVMGWDGNPTEGKAMTTKTTLDSLFEFGKGNQLPEVKGSLWAGYNAFTDYIDHRQGVSKKDGDGAQPSTESILFGSGANLRESAWEKALVMANS